MSDHLAHDPLAALRHREFRLFLGMRLLATLAIQVAEVVVAWKIYDLTRDAFILGLTGLAEAVPAISIAMFAGHWADRHDKKKMTLRVLSALGIVTLLLPVAMGMNGSGEGVLIAMLFTFISVTGLLRGFFGPSVFSLLSRLVDREHYVNSSTWNSMVWQTGAMAGPALGGWLFAAFGMEASLLIAASMMFIGVILLSGIGNKPPVEVSRENIFSSLSAGIRFVFTQPVILGALSLDLFAVLFGGAVAMLPVFAREILHAGPEALGLLRAAPSAGALVAIMILAYRPPSAKAGRNLLFSVAGFGICMILFALSTNFFFSLFVLALSGALDSVSVVVRSTVLQLMTPDAMRGRVSAVNSMFIGSSNEIGAFESGTAARLMGLVPSVVFGGMMTLAVVAFTAIKAPALKNLNLREIR
jgi:MFS family permease